MNWLNRMYTATYADYGGFPDPRRNRPGRVEVAGAYFNYPDVFLGTNEPPSGENPGIDFALYLYFQENWREKSVPFDYEMEPADLERSVRLHMPQIRD